jgi:hypothetical protein
MERQMVQVLETTWPKNDRTTGPEFAGEEHLLRT